MSIVKCWDFRVECDKNQCINVIIYSKVLMMMTFYIPLSFCISIIYFQSIFLLSSQPCPCVGQITISCCTCIERFAFSSEQSGRWRSAFDLEIWLYNLRVLSEYVRRVVLFIGHPLNAGTHDERSAFGISVIPSSYRIQKRYYNLHLTARCPSSRRPLGLNSSPNVRSTSQQTWCWRVRRIASQENKNNTRRITS